MKADISPATDVDEYIGGFPESTQQLLTQIRAIIVKAAPKAEEVISYQMPAYKYYGMLVYFAGYKKHIGFYPAPMGIEAFEDAKQYETGKGTMQFPLDKPLPLDLISRIVKLRVEKNLAKAKKN